MVEAASAVATPADAAAQPQVGNPPAQAADAQQPQAGGADDEGQAAVQRDREIEKLRKEAASYRTKLREFEDRDKSELQKALDRAEQAEKAHEAERAARRQDRLQMASFTAARKLGFRNPDIAYRLLDVDDIDFGDDGNAKNVETLLEKVAKAEPYLVNSATDFGGGPRGKPPTSADDMNARIRKATGRA